MTGGRVEHAGRGTVQLGSVDRPTAEALVVVDVQAGWVEGQHAVVGAESLVEVVAAAAGAARQAGALVVHVQDVGDSDSSVPVGGPGRRLVLPVAEEDLVVGKEADDAFSGTGLEPMLRSAGVDVIAVVGLQSEMCVAATARTALARGFGVVLPRDGHATRDVPADGTGPAVPAAHVSRVAEWSLGDEVVVCPAADQVRFRAPGHGSRRAASPRTT